MAEWTNIQDESLEPDRPIRSVDGLALRDNPIAIAEGAEGAPRVERDALQFTFELLDSETIDIAEIKEAHPDWFLFARLWGAGGGGGDKSGSANAGGGGGGYAEISLPVSGLPDSLSVNVGSGATGPSSGNSTDHDQTSGGSTYITLDNGDKVGASGGGSGGFGGLGGSVARGGTGGGLYYNGRVGRTAVASPRRSGGSNAAVNVWQGGSGSSITNGDTDGERGGDAWYGAGGGGMSERRTTRNQTTDGGGSLNAGNGGDGDGGDGKFPGGGGAGGASSSGGVGGDGLAIIQIRSWR